VDDIRAWAERSQNSRCAYCMLTVGHVARREADLDHVVPKAASAHPEWTFEALNLVLACSWCNRRLKKGTDYSLGPQPDVSQYRHVTLRIVHPYLDQDREQHFTGGYLGGTQVPSLIKPQSPKGKLTIEVFHLGNQSHLDMWQKEYRAEVTRAAREALPQRWKAILATMSEELGLRPR
jgi:uncharacterized protein (TIGR02646 family)